MEGRPLEESELVARARRGDVGAYEEIVRRDQEIAFRTAYLITGNVAEAEEAVEDAFVKAFRALGRFHSGAHFRPWLLRIVANEARNRRKAAARRTNLALRLAEDRPADDAAPSPEAAVLAAERREAVLRALAGLRDEERLAVAYRYFFDLPEAEIADALGCARGTVKSRLSRALSHLRQMLDVSFEGPLSRRESGLSERRPGADDG